MFRECVELIAFQRISALGMDSIVALLFLTGESIFLEIINIILLVLIDNVDYQFVILIFSNINSQFVIFSNINY